LADETPIKSPTGVTDKIIQEEIRVHWTARLMRPVRRLYEWTLHWAETKYAGTALAAVAFSEAVWFPVPADPLLIALCLGKPRRSFWYALNCTFWSTTGAMLAWYLGTIFSEQVMTAMNYIGEEENVRQTLEFFKKTGFWGVAAAALTPFIPYKVFAWTAGFAKINWFTFLAATVLFRKFRYFVIAGLLYFYGERARTFIDKYFNKLCAAVVVILVLVVVLVKYREPIWGFVSGLWGG
jgi:membrane protein YqaA with SNARE-associated domain